MLWFRNALDQAALARIDRIAEAADRPGGRPDWTAPDLAQALAPVTDLLRQHALPGARLVRVTWFTKDARTNWGVPWHQDRIIAVAAREDLPGFGNWSRKSGVWHCEPPPSVFDQMRFVRLHLDACDAANGAMEIALGSEAAGVVPEAMAAATAARYPTEICTAARGDVQVLPMLVLHRSRPAQNSAPRRALRLDFTATDLPAPLAWISP